MKTRLIFALVAAFTAPAFAQTDEPLAAATAFFTAWLEGNSELAPDDKLVLVRAAFGALPEMVQAHQGVREIAGNAAPSAAGHGDALRLPLVITAQDGTTFPRVVTLHHTADGWRIRL